MSWPVYVINMKNNTARMAQADEELRRCGVAYTRFEAVNGRALTEDELSQVYDPVANARRARHPLVGPEIGCYLSHLELWRRIASGEERGGVILEDDFAAPDDFAAVLAAVAEDEGDWEIVKLFTARRGQKILDTRPLLNGRQIGTPYKVPNTTLGYAIRRDAAARLAKIALPLFRPIDEDHKHFWERDLRIALVDPSPLRFGTHSTDANTITAARRDTSRRPLGGLLKQAWRTLRFRLNYLIGLHWNRLVKRR